MYSLYVLTVPLSADRQAPTIALYGMSIRLNLQRHPSRQPCICLPSFLQVIHVGKAPLIFHTARWIQQQILEQPHNLWHRLFEQSRLQIAPNYGLARQHQGCIVDLTGAMP